MNTFDTYIDLPDNVKGHVVVIGNFDGIHKGHETLFKSARDIAQRQNLKTVVLTFSPHPQQFFQNDVPSFRLTNDALKAQDILNHGIDYVVFAPFDEKIAQQSPEDFINTVLVDALNAQHIVVGDDFKFGKNRRGSVETLISDKRLSVSPQAQVLDPAQMRYGSSHIRQAIAQGNMTLAHDLLGRYWTTQGIVIHGDKRGRTIGYPTANMRMDSCGDFIHPAYGIYAVRCQTVDGTWHDGVANFGIRPMFELSQPLLEVHLFDFDHDIYDQTLTIEWIAYLRGEMNFDNLDDLIVQIDQDSSNAKQILKNI